MIRIGIYGYGNLGRGLEAAIKKNDDILNINMLIVKQVLLML